MSRKVMTRACITGFSANAKRVEIKAIVDATDVSACEDLFNMRGREVVLTVEETQEQMEFDDE